MPGGRDPIRIVCDSRLSTPLSARLVRTAGNPRTIIATCCTDPVLCQPYLDAGCELLSVPATEQGQVDLPALMQALGARGVDSIILEGGGTLNWSALQAGIVQRVQAYIAPKLSGGREAKTPVEGAGIALMSQAIALTHSSITRLGEDFLIESEVVPSVYGDR